MVFHLKKFLRLFGLFYQEDQSGLLNSKSAEDICGKLVGIFCDSGPPHILHSDNGKEFSNIYFYYISNQIANNKDSSWKIQTPKVSR